MQYAGAKVYGLNWLCNLHLGRIVHCTGHVRYYVIVCLTFLRTQPHLATSWFRRHLWYLWLPRYDNKIMHKLSKCYRVMVWLHSFLFAASQLPEPSIKSSCTSYLSHGSSRPCPPNLVGSFCQASSTSAECSPCRVVPFGRFCPLPRQVRHLRSACHALHLLHHHTSHPHHPHCRKLQDGSDCLR